MAASGEFGVCIKGIDGPRVGGLRRGATSAPLRGRLVHCPFEEIEKREAPIGLLGDSSPSVGMRPAEHAVANSDHEGSIEPALEGFRKMSVGGLKVVRAKHVRLHRLRALRALALREMRSIFLFSSYLLSSAS